MISQFRLMGFTFLFFSHLYFLEFQFPMIKGFVFISKFSFVNSNQSSHDSGGACRSGDVSRQSCCIEATAIAARQSGCNPTPGSFLCSQHKRSYEISLRGHFCVPTQKTLWSPTTSNKVG